MTSTRTIVLAAVIIVQLACGDLVRNLIGYPAWGVTVALTVAWAVVELVRMRVRVLRAPVALWAWLVLALASAVWAISPWATLLGWLLLAGGVACGLVLATLPWRTLAAVVHWCLQGLIIASFAFECFVEVVVGRPVYPLWADYSGDVPRAYEWSRALLFDGGRIQGVMGNSNLLSMVALLALIVAIARAVDRVDRRSWPLWIALPLAALMLAGSATGLVGIAAVGVVAGLVVVGRRASARAFRGTLVGLVAAAIAALVAIVAFWAPITRLLGRDADLTGRFDIWRSVVELGMTSPVVGVGWMGYWQPWVAPFDALAIHKGVTYLQAHNAWLDVFMQLGIVGVIVWGALNLIALRRSIAWCRAHASALAAVPLLIMTAELTQSLTESRPLIELGFVLLVAFVTGLGRERALLERVDREATR